MSLSLGFSYAFDGKPEDSESQRVQVPNICGFWFQKTYPKRFLEAERNLEYRVLEPSGNPTLHAYFELGFQGRCSSIHTPDINFTPWSTTYQRHCGLLTRACMTTSFQGLASASAATETRRSRWTTGRSRRSASPWRFDSCPLVQSGLLNPVWDVGLNPNMLIIRNWGLSQTTLRRTDSGTAELVSGCWELRRG